MTPFARLARRLTERLLDRWREGPEPPARLAEEAEAFQVLNPGATAHEWASFAARLSQVAYREGYLRGWEAGERFDRPWEGEWTPERWADLERPGWRDSPPVERADGVSY